MARFQFSEIFIKGVKDIVICSNESFIHLLSVLGKTNIGTKPKQLSHEIEVIEELRDNALRITSAIFSIADLSAVNKIDDDEIIEGLLDSFSESNDTEGISESIFHERIFELLRGSSKIKKSVRIFDLSTKGKTIYRNSVIVSDIRIAFDDDIKSDDKRSGVIIHNLSIRYNQNEGENNSQTDMTLDMRDLIDLKKQIDRAIEKEQILKSSYSDFIDFIELS